MNKKVYLILAFLAVFQFYGCQDPAQDLVEKESQQNIIAHNRSTARGPQSSNAPFFPLMQLFLAKSSTDCDNKVNDMINYYFGTNDGNGGRIYKEAGNSSAYILDINNNDVRSEGMSYGMMITVQLDMKTEFDKLWKWAQTNMQNSNKFFAWQCSTNGTKIDSGSAPDGEEYFAMALYFAYNRWGTQAYKTAADDIVRAMLNNSPNMFGSNNLVAFVPGSSFTDPSYHLPAFYELFAKWGPSDLSDRWKQIATASRKFLRDCATKSAYGLVPDYAEFNGNPNTTNGHDAFRHDAWRTVMNVTLDIVWCGSDYQKVYDDYGLWPSSSKITATGLFPIEYHLKLLQFFDGKGLSTHGNQFKVDGSQASDNGQGSPTNHSVGLTAMNAVAARTLYDLTLARAYAQEFWNSSYPTNDGGAYYDGCLYMFSMLFCTGNYNVIEPGNVIKPLLLQAPSQIYVPNKIKSAWSGKVLTATSTQNDAATKAQPANSSWTSQDWELEAVYGTDRYRLRNKWTAKYLNVQNQNENAAVVCYDLNNSWTSMQWTIEPVSGSNTQVRLKNVWSGRYLTVENTSDYANIKSQALNTSWASQKWTLE